VNIVVRAGVRGWTFAAACVGYYAVGVRTRRCSLSFHW